MAGFTWTTEFPASITVCDREGIILEMNDRAAQIFRNDGGKDLIGRNLLDCHPEPSRTRLQGIMERQTTNIYTIEKDGIKKLIYQAPWYQDGRYAGFVELALEIPVELPHFVRQS